MMKWIDEIKKQGPNDIIIAIVGNKCDLESKVNQKEALSLSQSVQGVFGLTSAKINEGINELFDNIMNQYCLYQLSVHPSLDSSKIKLSPQQNRNSNCAC
eukprot:TRINITY_DN10008_c0_g1_i4.p1 TRINITY_DN10008_c0_g1~~TRINITY_DN10008_c0_g1_i4.p1  ORF type:complete len:100 (+),score=12.58 TRINITY_DN10008_c0_g1_i4:336-635(+)